MTTQTETKTTPAKALTGREQRNLEKLIKEDFATAYRELSGQHDHEAVQEIVNGPDIDCDLCRPTLHGSCGGPRHHRCGEHRG